MGDATQLHQVVMNLCTNASGDESRRCALRCSDRIEMPELRSLSHGRFVTSLPAAHGERHRPGIPSTVLERMFDPFFTTKGVGEGTAWDCRLCVIVADLRRDRRRDESRRRDNLRHLAARCRRSRKAVAETAHDLPRGNGEAVMIVDDERAVALAEENAGRAWL